MINVLFTTNVNDLPNGAAQSMFSLIESLGNNIKPIVLCLSKSKVYDYLVKHGIECYDIRYPALIDRKYSILHILIHPWHMHWVKIIRFRYIAKKFLKKEMSCRKIDIIHSNELTSDFGRYISKVLKVKHVWHIREYMDMDNHIHGVMCVRPSELINMVNKADARVVISNPCRQYWGFKEENTWTIWDAVCSINDSCYKQEKQPYILFCSGCVSEGKGARFAVTAFGMSGLYASSKTQLRLKIVGYCPDNYKQLLITVADNYHCSEYIDFIPVQEDIKPYFANAMAYVNPSLTEGFGRTTAEAMFYGCPVVARASGGTLDLIRHGETGWLFDTEEECAELLKKVCTTYQEQIILKAQEFAKQNLSIENYGKKILKIYHKLLNN